MNTDAELLSRIFEITRGDLENVIFPFPEFEPIFNNMMFVRITRLARFWKEQENENRISVELSTQDLIAGLHGQSCPWLFFLKGSSRKIECWFGFARDAFEKPSWQSMLSGVYPDIRMSDEISFDLNFLRSLKHAVFLTGTPSSKTDNGDNSKIDQIEKLCRGLYGSNWMYAIYAHPVPAIEIIKHANELSKLIRDVYTRYLLKSSAADEQNRIAIRYVELLEEKLKRFELGRTLGMWNVSVVTLADNTSVLGRAKGLLHSAFSGERSIPDPVRVRPCSLDEQYSPTLEPLNSAEVAILARPPLEEYPGYEIVEYSRFGVETNDPAVQESSLIKVGDVLDRGINTGNSFHIPLRELTKHGLIVGVTGSGKTNTCLLLLEQIWDGGKGVPFLVIESAKSEYRNLLRNPAFRGLKIFTVGDETTSPLRINPFEVPKGVLVQMHIDYLNSLFSAAFVLYPPMPYVLEQSIQEIYEDRGWDLARNINHRGHESARLFPTISDLAEKIGIVVDRMGYDQRITMDVKAGLLARIKQLQRGGGKGLMLDTRRSVDSSVFFESPCILELKQLVSDDEKAFVMGLLLMRLYEHHEVYSESINGGLRHVTLIEEAHRLLKNVSTEQGSEITANPKGRAIEVFANILSEIRAYGEGILLAEQIPVKLTPDAIKNTNLKVIHRLVAEDDRKAVGNTINLNQPQMRYLATLQPGEGIAYAENLQKPVLLSIPLSTYKDTYSGVSNHEIREAMKDFWNQNPDLTAPFPGCNICSDSITRENCLSNKRIHIDELLMIAFKRLFNAIRLDSSAVVDEYTDFRILFQRDPHLSKNVNSIYCLLVELVDTELERRGEYWQWSYEDIEKAANLYCITISNLSKRFGGVSREVLEKEIIDDSQVLVELLRRLHQIDTFPYVGCRFCLKPCQYRFDVVFSVRDLNVQDFRAAFLDPSIVMEKLAVICQYASMQAFPDNGKMRSEAALCFAVQQFGELGIARLDQEELAFKMAELLIQLSGESDG